MNGKSILSLLLALCLAVGPLSPQSRAEEPDAEAEAMEPSVNSAISVIFEPEQETRPSRLVNVTFVGGAPMALMDESGNVVFPQEQDAAAQSYLLAPGTYSYTYRDPNGPDGEQITELLVLDGLTREIEIRLEPQSEADAPEAEKTLTENAELMPVMLQGAEDAALLTVMGSDGAVIPPYTDPETGETHFGCYLLAPGAYRWTLRGEADGSFEVDLSGTQTVAVTVPEKPVSGYFSATAINPYYAGLIDDDAIPEPSVSPEESLEELLIEALPSHITVSTHDESAA